MRTIEDIHNEAPIVQKTLEFYKALYATIKSFPKKDQYLLGRRIEEHLLVFLELLLSASALPREEKSDVLFRGAIKFDTLKVLTRTACELKMMSQKQYIAFQPSLQEIGRMLGGWIRSLNEKMPRRASSRL